MAAQHNLCSCNICTTPGPLSSLFCGIMYPRFLSMFFLYIYEYNVLKYKKKRNNNNDTIFFSFLFSWRYYIYSLYKTYMRTVQAALIHINMRQKWHFCIGTGREKVKSWPLPVLTYNSSDTVQNSFNWCIWIPRLTYWEKWGGRRGEKEESGEREGIHTPVFFRNRLVSPGVYYRLSNSILLRLHRSG